MATLPKTPPSVLLVSSRFYMYSLGVGVQCLLLPIYIYITTLVSNFLLCSFFTRLSAPSLPLCLSACLSVCLSLSVSMCVCVCVCLSVSLSQSLCLSLSVSFSVSLCLSLSLSHSVSLCLCLPLCLSPVCLFTFAVSSFSALSSNLCLCCVAG